MDSCFATLALLSLIAAASSAPTGHTPCEAVRKSALMLNHAAKIAFNESRNLDIRDYHHFTFAWMDSTDLCDPESLKTTSTQCLVKLFRVLKSYKSALEILAGYDNCSGIVSKVKGQMDKLHANINTCVNLGAETGDSTPPASFSGNWQVNPTCRYTMERLYSFSILTARVFAVGDPAQHTTVTPSQCQ